MFLNPLPTSLNMFFILSLRDTPNPPATLYSQPMNDVVAVSKLVSCIVMNATIPNIMFILLSLFAEKSKHPASPGILNKPIILNNKIPLFNRLYVSEVYNLQLLLLLLTFAFVALDKILQTPPDKNKYPNVPAVYVANKFG